MKDIKVDTSFLNRTKAGERQEGLAEVYKSLTESRNISKEGQKRQMLRESVAAVSPGLEAKNKRHVEEQKRLYENTIAKDVYVDVLTDLVIESLLVDIEEYSKLNPNYRGYISSLIETVIEGVGIPTADRVENILLAECLLANLPESEVGIYMESEEIAHSVKELNKEKISTIIDELSKDVVLRVTDIISKEKEEVQKIEDEINEVVSGEGLKVFTKDAVPQGLVESIALSEAITGIRNGEEYNPDLALANAITTITVIEALQVSEVVSDLADHEYKDLVELFISNR